MLGLFQYPLCRIDGVNDAPGQGEQSQDVFQYPLCRIDGVNLWGRALHPAPWLFQYPLCRIDGVNGTGRRRCQRADGCFSIRSVGSMV